MTLKLFEILSILLAALVTGMFLGPWLALSRSIRTLTPEVFLAVVHRMSANMASVMTPLMPVAWVSMVPVLFLSHREKPFLFSLTLIGMALFAVALLVTLIVEVPIVKHIETWTVSTLPDNWRELRDRWGSFHLLRIVASLAGLVLLVVGVVFDSK
jgi:hypothetical protein